MQLTTVTHPAQALEGFRGIDVSFLRPGAAAIVPWKEYARLVGIDPTMKKKDCSPAEYDAFKKVNGAYKQLCREAQSQRRALAASIVADENLVVSNLKFKTRKDKITGEKVFVPGKFTIDVAPAKAEPASVNAKAQLAAATSKIDAVRALNDRLAAGEITVEEMTAELSKLTA